MNGRELALSLGHSDIGLGGHAVERAGHERLVRRSLAEPIQLLFYRGDLGLNTLDVNAGFRRLLERLLARLVELAELERLRLIALRLDWLRVLSGFLSTDSFCEVVGLLEGGDADELLEVHAVAVLVLLPALHGLLDLASAVPAGEDLMTVVTVTHPPVFIVDVVDVVFHRPLPRLSATLVVVVAAAAAAGVRVCERVLRGAPRFTTTGLARLQSLGGCLLLTKSRRRFCGVDGLQALAKCVHEGPRGDAGLAVNARSAEERLRLIELA